MQSTVLFVIALQDAEAIVERLERLDQLEFGLSILVPVIGITTVQYCVVLFERCLSLLVVVAVLLSRKIEARDATSKQAFQLPTQLRL
jgi:hypothetical protein